jgi:hypothetical protein
VREETVSLPWADTRDGQRRSVIFQILQGKLT